MASVTVQEGGAELAGWGPVTGVGGWGGGVCDCQSLSRGRKEGNAEGHQEGHTSLDHGIPRQLAGVWQAGAARSAAESRNEADGGAGVGGSDGEAR